MNLPNPEQALIPAEKIEGYSLNPDHAEGRHKAIVFQAALGVGLAEATELRLSLQQAIVNQAAVPIERNAYGQKYCVDFEMTRLAKRATIRSIWIVRNAEDFPRLVTCHVV